MKKLVLLLILSTVTDAFHFNGGTITWAPVNPYDNSSSVNITIIQSYSWTYPTVTCTTNVPISTPAYSTATAYLNCVADCTTDGGYSIAPVSILTDCTSYSSSLGMMASQRSVNITLNASAYFYISYTGAAWRTLYDPSESGLSWSILSLIDLRIRDDGIINTPPVATVVSPQYVIVNTTTQIEIPTSDVNEGDTVRCRWAVYQAGHNRRRRQTDEDSPVNLEYIDEINQTSTDKNNIINIRKKRNYCSSCSSTVCSFNCWCSCPICEDTTCTGTRCTTSTCPAVTTTTRTTLSTASFLYAPIDECAGICNSNSLPNDTTLSNCTLSFTGLIPNTWYAISIQVEDFINDTSTIAMSSVPVQFLIYVLPTPTCSIPPVILPVTSCLEVKVGIPTSIILYAMNLCGSSATITDIIVSKAIVGMVEGSLQNSTTNSSLVYVTFTWTPQTNQIGSQQLCTFAFDDQSVQSAPYCVIFTVTASTPNCTTTTTSVASTVTQAPSKQSNSVNTPLIVGLSFLGLLLSLCCSCCLFYHLFWSNAARRRRQKQKADRVQRQKYLLSNPADIARNSSLKPPTKQQMIGNTSDDPDNSSTVQPRVQPIVSFPLKNRTSFITIKNTNVPDIRRTSDTDQSFIEDNTWVKLSQRQSMDTMSFPLYPVTRADGRSKSIPKNDDPNMKLKKPSTQLIDMNARTSNMNDDIIAAEPNIEKDNNEKINTVQLKKDRISNVRRPKIIKVNSEEVKDKRHSMPNDANIDGHNLPEEHSNRRISTNIVKLKRLSDKTPKPKDYENPTVPEGNTVTVTSVPQKHSKRRSRPSNHRKNVINVIEMS